MFIELDFVWWMIHEFLWEIQHVFIGKELRKCPSMTPLLLVFLIESSVIAASRHISRHLHPREFFTLKARQSIKEVEIRSFSTYCILRNNDSRRLLKGKFLHLFWSWLFHFLTVFSSLKKKCKTRVSNSQKESQLFFKLRFFKTHQTLAFF